MRMYSFRELQRARKTCVQDTQLRLSVMGNCSTQFFSQAIEGFAKLAGINVAVLDIDYNQIDVELIDPESEAYRFFPDSIVLWLCTEKLYEEFLGMDLSKRSGFAKLYLEKLQFYWEMIAKYSNAIVIQPNFPEIDDKVLGQYSCKVESTFVFQLRKLNYLMSVAASNNARVYPVDFLAIQADVGRDTFFSPKLYYSSKMPISFEALPRVAKAVTDVLHSTMGRIKKCVVLDLDNTLWGGTIGDDGLSGIEIGDYGRGHVFSNLQMWLKQLKEYGIILAVCSKNNEETAKEVFEKHKDMILRLSDISIFVANWNDKASNIKLIQETLNIGMDSIVFLDDNPFERHLVKGKYPLIEVPELPEDPAQWLIFLQHNNYFDTATKSGMGGDRTKQYQEEFKRKATQQSYSSIDDYLYSLQMVGTAKSFEPLKYPRIAELTQRSNQFNLRTVRYTEDEIRRIAESPNYLTLYFSLCDKFGDYGLVSVLIMEKRDDGVLFVDTWLMSCRVLKRGMEEFVIDKLVQSAKNNGFGVIMAEYLPTPKNKMVKDIYKTLGFDEIGENNYRLVVDEYTMKNKYILEEE